MEMKFLIRKIQIFCYFGRISRENSCFLLKKCFHFGKLRKKTVVFATKNLAEALVERQFKLLIACLSIFLFIARALAR